MSADRDEVAAGETTTDEFSIPLPRSLDSKIYVRLTSESKHIRVFLTTASVEDQSAPAPMGSFVYALPDVSLLG
jgi:hypothetical protein